MLRYRLSNATTTPVEYVRELPPMDWGVWAGEPRLMVRHLADVAYCDIRKGLVRAVLLRNLVEG